MSGTLVTMTGLRQQIRERANMENSKFVTDDEMNRYINASAFELYGILVQKFEDYFVASPFSITTDGTTDYYALPNDFWKGRLVELQLGGTTGQYITLKRVEQPEINYFTIPNAPAIYGPIALRYRYRGNTIQFAPRAASGQVVRVHYVPRFKSLADNTQTITISGCNSGDTLTIGSTVLTAGTDFAINPSSLTTTQVASSLADALNRVADTTQVAASAASNVTSVGAFGSTVTMSTSSGGRFTLGSSTIPVGGVTDGYNGWLEYIVVDVALRCLQKENNPDTPLMMQQKAELRRRIEEEASNRDAGSPSRTVDVRGPLGSGWFGPGLPGDGWW